MRTSHVILLVLLVAVGTTILFWPTPRRRALEKLESANGTYTEEPDSDGRMLSIVTLMNQPATDGDLVRLRDIRPIHRLLLDNTKVTDAGLVHLEGIEGLEWVSVCKTRVTDAGMAQLARIRTLRFVHVRDTQVSDAGLAQLHGMPQLEFVNVIDSRVTSAGIEELRRTTPTLIAVSQFLHHPPHFFNNDGEKAVK